MRPVPHSDRIPVPTFTFLTQSFNETDSRRLENNPIKNDDYQSSSDQ